MNSHSLLNNAHSGAIPALTGIVELNPAEIDGVAAGLIEELGDIGVTLAVYSANLAAFIVLAGLVPYYGIPMLYDAIKFMVSR